MAFHVTKGGNRFNGCYADGGRCVLDGTPPYSGTSRNIWTNGFEVRDSQRLALVVSVRRFFWSCFLIPLGGGDLRPCVCCTRLTSILVNSPAAWSLGNTRVVYGLS